MATYSAQITDLVGGTIDQTACDQWAVDGVKEIIMQLPTLLQEQCVDKTTVTSSTALDFDTATVGKVLYCTRNNGSYDIPCRLAQAKDASLLDDSTASNHYATAGDPAYFIRDNKAEIKPNPGSDGASFYHIVFPSSIDVDSVSVLNNFPDEADYILVLYIAMKQLLQYQSTMSSTWNTSIGTANTAINAALDRIATYNWDDEDTFTTASSQLTRVKDALDKVSSLIEGNKPASSYDAHDLLQSEDLELMSGTLQIASTELSRAQVHLGEWSAISGVAIQEANGFIAEASARLQQDTTQYSWYGDQYAKLSAEYTRGLTALKGT